MNISLKYNKAFPWFKNDRLFFKGYFYVDDHFYEKENAINYVSKIKKSSAFKEFLHKINGVFTFIIHFENNLFVASDLTRTFPIFYTFQNNQLFLSDNILQLKNKFNLHDFDALSELELKSSNHTHGKKTLLKEVYQVQASEYLIIKNDKIIERNFFFSYAIKKESSDSYSILKTKTISAFENAFQRFINSLNNRTIVVPLSGGFDSRFIAVMLKKHHYKNVVCYTYGRKDSFEIENSKKTAEALGFKWLFIEYKPQLIKSYLKTDEFKEYAHFAGKLSSMPNLQEYFAVKYLKENQLIDEKSIFVPGFAGDILGGSEFMNTIPERLETSGIESLIIETKLKNHKLTKSNRAELKLEITKNLSYFDDNYHQKIPETVFEDYNIKERISKYIFNSASYYLFFGYEFRFPYWDKELLDSFKEVPIAYKRMKLLFDDIMINEYFKHYNVYFEKEIQPTKNVIQLQKIKDQIKPFLPTFIKQQFLQKNDWNNYKPITDQMLTSLALKGLKVQQSSHNYNEIITQWYLYFSKNMIK